MKKGIFSIDAIMALILITIVITSIQNYEYNSILDSEEFSILTQTEAASIAVGSQLNSIYASRVDAGTPSRRNTFNLIIPELKTQRIESAYSISSDGDEVTVTYDTYSSKYPSPLDFTIDENGLVTIT